LSQTNQNIENAVCYNIKVFLANYVSVAFFAILSFTNAVPYFIHVILKFSNRQTPGHS